MKKNKYILAGLALTMGLSSCSDFLSHVPDDRTVIESVDAVKELLVTAYPEATYMAFCEAMSDNAQDKGPAASGRDFTNNKQSYFWGEHNGISQDTYSYFWTNSYNAISTSNHVLEAIDGVEGKGKNAYKAEAYITRAYNHFMLVNVFAEHYDSSKNAERLGVPYITKAEKKVFVDYKRETLEKTYELIEDDLVAGINGIDNSAYDVRAYHFNVDAANTFASRFYLFTEKWDKVVEHSNQVLTGDVAKRLRGWNTSYVTTPYAALKLLYTKSDETSNLLLASVMTWYGRNYPSFRYGLATPNKTELFDQPTVVGGRWAYRVFGNEVSLNIPKFTEHFKYTSINSTTGRGYVMCPLFVIEEALLNRAEAHVMLNNFDAALSDLNLLLSTRIKDYVPSAHLLTVDNLGRFYKDYKVQLNPVYSLSEEQRLFLNAIVDFRRHEFIFEGMRWFDIKRFHIEVIRKPFQSTEIEDTLTKDDLRRAAQIPQDAITYGIEPNPR